MKPQVSVACALALAVSCSSPVESTTEEAPLCPSGQLALPNGTCIAPGLRAEDCGAGFRFDGVDGCYPVLPPDPCPSGLMAVPGEEHCRPVAPCPSTRFGEAEGVAGAIYVDGSYLGTDSDGSAARPWQRVQDAVNAAQDGATIGIAAGSYVESVTIDGKAVQLMGRCPDMVEIVGRSNGVAPVYIPEGGAGSRVSMIAATGAGEAGIVTSAPGVTIDRVWVHDMPVLGVVVQSPTIKGSAVVRDVLVERVTRRGIYAIGGDIDVARASVRDVDLVDGGGGIVSHSNSTGEIASVDVVDSLVVRTGGVWAESARLTLDGVAVIDVRGAAGGNVTSALGVGGTFERPASMVVDRSYVALVDGIGALVLGGDAIISRTLIRDVYDGSSPDGGVGVFIDADGLPVPSVSLERVVVQSTIDTSVVHQVGRLAIAGSVFRDVAPPEPGRSAGIGIVVVDARPPAIATLQLSGSLVERVPDSGVLVHGTDVVIEDSVIRAVFGPPDAIADGVSVRRFEGIVPEAHLRNVRLDDNGRAGVTAAGGRLVLEGAALVCNGGPDINGETFMSTDFDVALDDATRCGCPDADQPCRITTLGLFQ